MCPFEIVYGFLPRAPIDFLPLPSSEKVNFDAKKRAELILKMHELTKENIERMNARYKFAGDKGRKHVVFELGDLVWLHLRKDRFPDLRKSKLMPRADGPFKVLQKINDNAYKLELPAVFWVSPTFNIADLKPYLGEDDELPSRTTSIQEGEDDEDISANVTPTSPPSTHIGPVTRARDEDIPDKDTGPGEEVQVRGEEDVQKDFGRPTRFGRPTSMEEMMLEPVQRLAETTDVRSSSDVRHDGRPNPDGRPTKGFSRWHGKYRDLSKSRTSDTFRTSDI